jgi:excisionase family DNA binding protein
VTPHLTEKEVMQRLDISRTTLWELRKKGLIAFLRIGSAVRYREADVLEFEKRMTVNPSSRR